MPFSKADFFAVMKLYNEATGSLILAFYVLATVLAIALLTRRKHADRAALLFLAFMWLWMGVIYHWTYFTLINPAAWIFGLAFVVQAALLAVAAFKNWFNFYRHDDLPSTMVAGGLMAYALVLYPVIESRVGQGYPNGPIFGLPCPTTIFTFGVLVLLGERSKRMLAIHVVPVAWSLIAVSAAFAFDVVGDFALPISAAISFFMLTRSRYKHRANPPLIQGVGK